jgi:hypothetical protein
MSQDTSKDDRREARIEFWKTVVVPAARGLERFLWNALWFAFFVTIVFYILERA